MIVVLCTVSCVEYSCYSSANKADMNSEYTKWLEEIKTVPDILYYRER